MTQRDKQRILVTGGGGFIGSHLCQRLLDHGHSVICLDNFVSSSLRNIDSLLGHSQFEFIQQDVSLPLNVQVNQIYNLACPASPVQYQLNPVQTIRTNVAGATNVLELAKATGARVLQASTSEIYGDPAVHPQPESYWGHVNPIGLRACYDEGKRCAEALFFAYHQQFAVDIKVVRIFNTYGPRTQLNDGRVISNFTVQALRGDDITVYGDGSQTRSFCYVDDLVSGLIAMMNSEQGFTGPVNLGNPEEITILELAQMLKKLTSSGSAILLKALPQDDPRQRMPDIQLAQQRLNWHPCTTLSQGLARTIEYFAQELARVNRTSPAGPPIHSKGH